MIWGAAYTQGILRVTKWGPRADMATVREVSQSQPLSPPTFPDLSPPRSCYSVLCTTGELGVPPESPKSLISSHCLTDRPSSVLCVQRFPASLLCVLFHVFSSPRTLPRLHHLQGPWLPPGSVGSSSTHLLCVTGGLWAGLPTPLPLAQFPQHLPVWGQALKVLNKYSEDPQHKDQGPSGRVCVVLILWKEPPEGTGLKSPSRLGGLRQACQRSHL